MTEGTPQTPPPQGAFAPLRRPLFAVLWAATVLGNTGTFMRDVATAWLVTDLSSSPAAVALVQAAGTLPIFLLAVPAGVLSDILDKRRLLICIQILLGCVSLTLMLLAWTGLMTVTALVSLSFAGGLGAALMAPAWQAIVPELVPRAEMKSAVALNSLGINIARSIGPAVGGLLLASFGAAFAYGADVASYLIVIAALVWWRRPPTDAGELTEHFSGAFRAGLRYAAASRELHIVLAQAAIFFAFSSAVWALLPLVARGMLGGGAGFYGALLACVGAGAIAGAIALPRLRASLGADGLILLSALVLGLATALLAFVPSRWLAVPLLLLAGGAWIAALTTFNAIAQSILPNWVRGRALAVYLTVFNGAMALGSLGWGLVAQTVGVPTALVISGAGLALVHLALRRWALPAGDTDLSPSNHWPEPLVAAPLDNDRGPVMILIEYRIAPEDRPAFLEALRPMAAARRRDGAYAWGITEDTANPETILEWFMVESWAEHLRQHRRVSKADAEIQAAVMAFHRGLEPPAARHFLALDLHARPDSVSGIAVSPPRT